MINQYTGLIAFLKKQDGIDKNAFINYDCIIYQENLCAKTLQFDAIMKVVNDVVKFIRAKTLKDRQSKGKFVFLASLLLSVFYTRLMRLNKVETNRLRVIDMM